MMNIVQSIAHQAPQLDDFCRICLLRKPLLRPLASQYSTDVMIPEMLYKVTGALLNLQEQLPRAICERCLVKLDLAYSISEEFRKQEELLRRFWFKGLPLVDQLVEYGAGLESQRKPYSEEVIERLAGPVVPESRERSTNLNGTDQTAPMQPVVQEQKPEISIEILSDDSDDEILAVYRKPPDEPASDPELEMVLELEDIQSSDGLPAQVKEQLVKQEIVDEDSEAEQDDDEKDSDYVPEEIEESRTNKNSPKPQTTVPLTCKFCSMSFRYHSHWVAHQTLHQKSESGRQQPIDNQRSVSRSSSGSQRRTKGTKTPFECKYCKKTFRWKSRLIQHEKYHERKEAPVYPSMIPELNQQDGIVQCKLCPRIYSNVSYLIKHMKVDHETEPGEGTEEPIVPFKCTRCKRTFDEEWKLEEHIQRHKAVDDGKFQCKKCNHKFTNQFNLDQHARAFNSQCPLQIVRDGKTFYKCRLCCKTYVSRSNYVYHAKCHHGPKSEAFQCPDCGKRFVQRFNLRKHQQQVHKSFVKEEPQEVVPVAETTVLHCTECDTLFQTHDAYEAHLREHRGDVGASSEAVQEDLLVNQPSAALVTKQEQVTFQSNAMVQIQQPPPQTTAANPEMVVLSSDDESDDDNESDQMPSTNSSIDGDSQVISVSTNCHICGAIFTNRKESTIRKHLIRHENVQLEKFKCEVCYEVFSTSTKFQKHRRLVHNLNDQQEVECEVCQQMISLNRYDYHRTSHRNLELRLFVCSLCDRAFRSKTHLKQHVARCGKDLKSSSPKPPVVLKPVLELNNEQSRVEREGRFKCNECGKRFKSWESIASHTNMHRAMKEGLHRCQICQMACPSNNDLETHMMQEHPQPPLVQLPMDHDSVQLQKMETE